MEDLRKIIKEGNAKELNEFAKKKGEELVKEKLSTSQIRAVLSEIQRIHEFDKNKLQLIRPKLAYAAGRHAKIKGVRIFQELVDKAIEMVEDQETFENFRNFVEAIVAYHRYFGGE
jgi:CRISPR-associated protein Csm2